MNFDELCLLLEKNGFKCTAVNFSEGSKKIYRNNEFNLFVEVSEQIEHLTSAEEEKVKQRLRELGYLDE
jgi:hypothetical protein